MTSDAWYPKSSASITSITGQTTLVRFCAIRANRGSIQPSVASQWESKKVRTSPREISAPRNRARTSPSRLGIRRIFTFSNCRTCSSKGFLRFSVDYEISQNPFYLYNFSPIYYRSYVIDFSLASPVFPSPQKPIFPNSSSQSGMVL